MVILIKKERGVSMKKRTAVLMSLPILIEICDFRDMWTNNYLKAINILSLIIFFVFIIIIIVSAILLIKSILKKDKKLLIENFFYGAYAIIYFILIIGTHVLPYSP